ncbi:ABC transporter permease [Flavivirga rizhaonensis]|uniref:FtsX-like permease family protein n=1 Tax=Flavivirga rizhaonensis TaxID=2559571 RepID=A0A4V3P5B4_9FLAO|nr:ABC transporter permease [Flavivirga rizhaonensis]TGV04704.1 FtsX-like permease family protein [Flavivirga rizhaonensis]
MLKNYIKMAFAVMMRRKLVTALSLMGISFTLAFITVMYSVFDLKYGNVYPIKDTKKMVYFEGFPAKSRLSEPFAKFYGREEMMENIGNTYKTYKQLQNTLESVGSMTFNNGNNIYGQRGNNEYGFLHKGNYTTISYKYVDAGYWDMMRFKLLDGSFFSHEDVKSHNNFAVINANTATNLFSNSDDALLSTINVNGKAYTVIGIVEDVGMKSREFADVWIPITTKEDHEEVIMKVGIRDDIIVFYLKDGATMEHLKKELITWYQKNYESVIAEPDPRLMGDILPNQDFNDVSLKAFKDYGPGIQNDMYHLIPLTFLNTEVLRSNPSVEQQEKEYMRADTKFKTFIILMAILFLSIPIINMVNLNSSQIRDRASEIGIRKSFGATTKHLVRQFLIENIILALLGGVLSIVLTLLAFNILEDLLLNSNPLRDVVGAFKLNWRVLSIGFISAIIFGIISGVLPAYKMSKLNVVNAIKGLIK